MSQFNSAIEERGLSLIVQIRRGGTARDNAIRVFESARRADGELVVAWWIKQIARELATTNVADVEDIEIHTRRGFIKALDTYVYRPGTKSLVRTLSRHIKMCVRSEAMNAVREGLTHSSRIVRESVRFGSAANDDKIDASVYDSSSIEETDTKLQIELIEENLTEEELFVFRSMLAGNDPGDLFAQSIREKVARVLFDNE